jgi:hypothetical protein
MTIKRIGPLSCAKIAGVLYAFIGLFIGALFALFSVAGGFATAAFAADPFPRPGFARFFGVGAIVFLPILYGTFGFVVALVSAALYNVMAAVVGGIEMDLE